MGQYTPGVIMSLEAGADLSTNQYCFVMAAGTGVAGNRKVVAATANASTIGVLNNAPAAGREAQVIVTGSAKLKVAGEIAVGAKIGSDANGKGVAVTGAGNYISAMALTYGAADNDIIEALVCHAELGGTA